MERRHITLPLTEELAKTLHAGDQVLLTGTIYTSLTQVTSVCVRLLQKAKRFLLIQQMQLFIM